MVELNTLAATLLTAASDDDVAALAIRAAYRPLEGADAIVFPPTFPPLERNAPPRYLHEQVWLDGTKAEVVVLDQVPSQANRLEEALGAATSAGRIALPYLELVSLTERGPFRLTSFEAPHRYADAYWREAMLDGKRFDQSPLGARLFATTEEDVAPLYEREPLSLILGAWNSWRTGRAVRFPRLYRSRVIGIGPVDGARAAGRMDPSNLTGAMDSARAARAGEPWKFIEEGAPKRAGNKEGKDRKLSASGLGNIAPVDGLGGVNVREIRRTGSISLQVLRRLRFGDAHPDGVRYARAALAALALAGDRLAFGGSGMWLRSGCDLVRTSEELTIERAGDAPGEAVTVTAAQALAAFAELREAAAHAGIAMAADVVKLEANDQLAKAIDFAFTAVGATDPEPAAEA